MLCQDDLTILIESNLTKSPRFSGARAKRIVAARSSLTMLLPGSWLFELSLEVCSLLFAVGQQLIRLAINSRDLITLVSKLWVLLFARGYYFWRIIVLFYVTNRLIYFNSVVARLVVRLGFSSYHILPRVGYEHKSVELHWSWTFWIMVYRLSHHATTFQKNCCFFFFVFSCLVSFKVRSKGA